MNWDCQTCHESDEKLFLSAGDCAECHQSELEGSMIHEVEFHAECTNCHKPHRWTIDPQTSCLTCHDGPDREEHAGGLECNLCHN